MKNTDFDNMQVQKKVKGTMLPHKQGLKKKAARRYHIYPARGQMQTGFKNTVSQCSDAMHTSPHEERSPRRIE